MRERSKWNGWALRGAAAVLVASAGATAVLPACDGGGTVSSSAAAAGQTIDLGGGVIVSLGADGSFSITNEGTTVVSTAPGVPLFQRTADPMNPDGWHDPSVAHPDLTTSAVAASAVSLSGDDDGSGTKAVHLVVAPQPSDTSLLTATVAAQDPSTAFYTGLGETFIHVSASGRVTPMFLTVGGQLESSDNEEHVPVPFLVSSTGWGMFVASREAGAFDVASTDPGRIAATFEGQTLDVWFFVNRDPLQVVARFNRLAGLPRPLPRWVLSLIHWRHWMNTADVLSIASEYRERHIPTSALWFDDGWQTALNTFVIAPTVFDDQPVVQEVGNLGYRTLAWSTPYLQQPQGPNGTPTNEAQQLWGVAESARWFVEDGTGKDFVPLGAVPLAGGGGMMDFTSPGAQAFWQWLVSRATTTGIHGFKCDYGEDIIPAIAGARYPALFSNGETSRTARLYPIEEHAAYHRALDAAFPGDGVIIARASSWGGATQADVIWPGDLDPDFSHYGDALASGGLAVGGLPAVVIDAQTLSVSGFPAFGSDTAGYRRTPTPESMMRWVEHTALTVVMQVYEDGDARLPWTFGAAAATEYQQMASLHMALVPYNAIGMTEAQTLGTPPIRPLALAFPGDAAGFARADDEYLLGPDLLVSPVMVAGATTKDVHLPPGKWVHWWSDTIYDGGQDATVPAPLGSPPLFARAGGLVPMLPPGIDTLVDATEPGIVTLASKATEMWARSWAMGPASATLDDGSTIAIADDSTGVTVSWKPGSTARNLTIDVDTRARTGASGVVSKVESLSGSALVAMSSQAQVEAATGGAWAIAGGHAYVRLAGAGSAVAR